MSGFTMNLCKLLFPVSDFAKIFAIYYQPKMDHKSSFERRKKGTWAESEVAGFFIFSKLLFSYV